MKLSQAGMDAIGRTEQIRLGEQYVTALNRRTLTTLLKHGLTRKSSLYNAYVTDKGRAVYRLDGYLPTPAVQEWLESADLETGALTPDYRTVQVRNFCQAQGFVEYIHQRGLFITDLGRAIAGLDGADLDLTHDCAADGHLECSQSDKRARVPEAGLAPSTEGPDSVAPRGVGTIVQEITKRFGPAEMYPTLRGILSGLLDELQAVARADAVREYKATLSGGHSGDDCQAHSCYADLVAAVTDAMASPFAGSDPDHWDGDDTEAGLCAQWIRTASEGARHQAARELRAWAREAGERGVPARMLSWQAAADRIDPFELVSTEHGPTWVRKSDRSAAPGPLIYQDEIDADEAAQAAYDNLR